MYVFLLRSYAVVLLLLPCDDDRDESDAFVATGVTGADRSAFLITNVENNDTNKKTRICIYFFTNLNCFFRLFTRSLCHFLY